MKIIIAFLLLATNLFADSFSGNILGVSFGDSKEKVKELWPSSILTKSEDGNEVLIKFNDPKDPFDIVGVCFNDNKVYNINRRYSSFYILSIGDNNVLHGITRIRNALIEKYGMPTNYQTDDVSQILISWEELEDIMILFEIQAGGDVYIRMQSKKITSELQKKYSSKDVEI